MAIVHQSSVFSSFRTINSDIYPPKLHLQKLKFKTLKISASLESSSPNSEEGPPESENFDRVKLAFSKAKAYKKEIQTKPIPKIVQNPVVESAKTEKQSEEEPAESEEIDPIKLAFAKAKAYKKEIQTNPTPNIQSGGSKEEDNFSEEQEVLSPVKLAFERAKEYKKNNEVIGSLQGSEKPPDEEPPESEKIDPVKLAFAKAKAYKKEIQINPTPKIVQNPVPESAETERQSGGFQGSEKKPDECSIGGDLTVSTNDSC